MKKITFYFLLISFALSVKAQPWMTIAESRKAEPNFYDIQQAFTEYYNAASASGKYASVFRQKHGFEEGEDIPGYVQYKRWEYFWEPRVYPTGEFPNAVDVY